MIRKENIQEVSVKPKQNSEGTARIAISVPFSLVSEIKHWCIDDRKRFHEVIAESLQLGWRAYKQKSK